MGALRMLAGILLVGAGVTPVRAHDPGISTAQGELGAGRLDLITGFAPADVESLLPASVPRAGQWGQEEFEAVREHLVRLAPQLWEVREGERVLPLQNLRVELLPGDNVSFRLLVALAPGMKRLTLRALKIADLPSSHRQFVIIADERGSTIAKKLLSARDFTLELPLVGASAGMPSDSAGAAEVAPSAPEEESDLPSAAAFIRLGVEHIWMGYDHLLFLFALLIVCRSFRSIVAIVTCFTLAHSLTLALATLDLVHLPSRWVEPLIAASIVFVGAENLIRRGQEPPGRWALTFAFGLVHGFGFASVLRDLGVGGGGQGILMPLFTFNLGVELGQVAIAAIILPIVWRLRKNEKFVARGVPALSAAVALMGLYWLLERTVL
jgi:hydrogenase/urease accessory protein HupE